VLMLRTTLPHWRCGGIWKTEVGLAVALVYLRPNYKS